MKIAYVVGHFAFIACYSNEAHLIKTGKDGSSFLDSHSWIEQEIKSCQRQTLKIKMKLF